MTLRLNTFLTFMLCVFIIVLGVPKPGHAASQKSLASGEAVCDFQFSVKGIDVQIFIGKSKLKGTGVIQCQDAAGNTETLNVKVKMGTPFIFPRLAFAPSIAIQGESHGIHVRSGGASSILGNYLTVDVRGSISSGAGATLSLLSEDSGLALSLTAVGVEGFGIAVGGTIVTIEESH